MLNVQKGRLGREIVRAVSIIRKDLKVQMIAIEQMVNVEEPVFIYPVHRP